MPGKESARTGDDGALNAECLAVGNRCYTATSVRCGIVPIIMHRIRASTSFVHMLFNICASSLLLFELVKLELGQVFPCCASVQNIGLRPSEQKGRRKGRPMSCYIGMVVVIIVRCRV